MARDMLNSELSTCMWKWLHVFSFTSESEEMLLLLWTWGRLGSEWVHSSSSTCDSE